MTTKAIITGIIMAILINSTTTVGTYASTSIQKDLNEKERESGFYDKEGYVLDTDLRPAINPDLDPDLDCNLAYELKCIPGSEQQCVDLGEFYNAENNVCAPKGGCSQHEGYVVPTEDEHGLCISYERCENDYTNYVLLKDEGECVWGADVCHEPEHSSKDYCVEWREERGE